MSPVDPLNLPSRLPSRIRSMMRGTGLPLLLAGILAAALWHGRLRAEEGAVLVPAPVLDEPMAPGPARIAVLSGGCFWGVQGVFSAR